MNTSVKGDLSVAFERMFVRGGKHDNLISFIVGQIWVLLLSSGISAIIFGVVLSLPHPFTERIKFLEILKMPLAMGILGLMIWVHEMTHMIMFRRYGAPVFGLIFPPIGGLMVSGRRISPKHTINVALAGPLTGIAALPLLIIGIETNQPPLIALAIIWAGVNLLNLLPFYPLDGGWVLKELVRLWLPKYAKWVVWGVSLAAVVLLYTAVPEKALLIVQLVLVVMMAIADRIASAVFVRFSAKYKNEAKEDLEPLTGESAWKGFTSYLILVLILALLFWLSLTQLL